MDLFVIAVLQQKGGSGKTTLAVNLAAAAHLRRRRTLIVDLDRQASAFSWSAARPATSPLEGLTVVRADTRTDRALPVPRLREMTRDYECVLLDGPPRLGEVTRSAAVFADVVVMPITPGPFDFWAVGETLSELDQADAIRAELGRPPARRVFVINRASAATRLSRQAETELAAAADEHHAELGPSIRQRVAYADAAARGESVLTAYAKSDAALEVNRLWTALAGKQGDASCLVPS